MYDGPERRVKSGSILQRASYDWTRINTMRHTDTHRIPNATIAEPPQTVPPEPERIWASKPPKPKKAPRRQSDMTAAQIREIRLSLGMTQKELAAELCVSKQAVWYWEAGQNTIGLYTEKLLLELARNYQKTV